MRVYVASPLGFAESTRAYLAQLSALLKAAGHEVFDPWDVAAGVPIADAERLPLGPERLERLHEANTGVGRRNEGLIRACDAVVAVLDGVDVDSGTASEIGFAYGLGKPILGLRTDTRRTGENDGAIVNLQVQYWIEQSGGALVRSIAEMHAALDVLAL